MITTIERSWTVHEQGQEPIDGVKVYQWPDNVWQCEVHRYWLEDSDGLPCVHIAQVMSDMVFGPYRSCRQ